MLELSTGNLSLEHQQELLDFGSTLINKSRKLVLELWNQASISSELKEDLTPVSSVDLKCEELLRTLISQRYPTHGIIGEEFGSENPEAEFVWTLDPIDGTQNLINRIPTFGIIIGLLYKGQSLLGLIDHPALGITVSGGKDCGTFYNGERIYLKDLSQDILQPTDLIATNCLATFKRGGHEARLWEILGFHPHSRIYYDVYAHTLAITGSLALMVEYNLKIWDLSATQALITGAGGKYLELHPHSATEHESEANKKVYHAAFGKPKAVDLFAALGNRN